MCGRYTLSAPGEVIEELFDVTPPAELDPRYNIAPTQESAVVRAREEGDGRRCDLLRWGLVPFWADDPGIGNRLINARSETAAKKPAFRNAFKKHRCLVLADGFYEWRKEPGGKQPYWIHLPDAKPFAMAGLWESWRENDDDQPLETFTILTTDAHDKIAGIHGRMPVILRREEYDAWLAVDHRDREALEAMLTAQAGEWLEYHPVSRRVNSPGNEGPENIEPAG